MPRRNKQNSSVARDVAVQVIANVIVAGLWVVGRFILCIITGREEASTRSARVAPEEGGYGTGV